jgi:hypothetical protein
VEVQTHSEVHAGLDTSEQANSFTAFLASLESWLHHGSASL